MQPTVNYSETRRKQRIELLSEHIAMAGDMIEDILECRKNGRYSARKLNALIHRKEKEIQELQSALYQTENQ